MKTFIFSLNLMAAIFCGVKTLGEFKEGNLCSGFIYACVCLFNCFIFTFNLG